MPPTLMEISKHIIAVEEIWELNYAPTFKVPLFKCQWVKATGGGVAVDN